VVNTESRELLEGRRAKSWNPQALQQWVTQDGKNRLIYFEQKNVKTYELQKRLGGIPKERLDTRKNVEATIFQVMCHYRRDMSRYRWLMKYRMLAISRCIWENFRWIQLLSIRKTEN